MTNTESVPTSSRWKDKDELVYIAELLENATHSIISTDPNTHIITSINKVCEELSGYKAKDLIGRHVQCLIPQAFSKMLDERTKKGERWEADTIGIMKDGTTFPLSVSVSYIFDDKGNPKRSIVIAKDIRKEKEIEEKLRYMAELLESAAYCIISTTPKGVIKSINTAGEKMFEFKAEELIGKPVSIIQAANVPLDLRKKLKDKADRGENWEAESLGVKKGGDTFPIWLATSYLFDEGGKIKSTIGISRDISKQKEVEERSHYMAELLESAAYCIISTSPRGIIKSINTAGEKMFGYKAEELIDKNVRIIQSPNISPELMKQLDEKARKGENWETESLGIRKDGTVFPIWLATSYLFDEDNTIKSTIGISQDISKQKEVEERFRYMAELLESATYCIISTSPNGIIKSINTAGEKMFGYTIEELIGKHVRIIQSPNILPSLMNQLDEKAKRGENWETESLGIRKDGSTFPIWLGTSYLFDENGKIKSTIGISRDITQEKEVEERLRYLAQLLERAAYPIISTDNKNIIQSINEATEKLYGYSADELIGKHVGILYTNRNPLDLLLQIEDKLRRGENWEAELWRKKKTGEEILSLITTSYILDEQGKIKTKISIERDITKIKQMEEELIRSTKLAGLGEMAAGIAHEIKNPLTGVALGLEKLEKSVQPGSREEKVLEMVSLDIDRINNIVSRLLDLARRKKPDLELHRVNDIVNDMILNISSPSTQKGIEINTSLTEELAKIYCDESQLYQVFLNLALNAIQAMDKGDTLTISTTRINRKGAKKIAISFRDTGVGISRENIKMIFEPFFSSREGGTGLGLTICHNIIKDHNGELVVESIFGEGTTMTVLLPEEPS